MILHRVSRSGLVFVAGLALIAGTGVGSSHAEDVPPDIADTLAEAEQICRAIGGKPDTGAILSGKDLNGDGKADWVADYARFKCDGARNPLCNDIGCTLQLYFFDGVSYWDLVFEDFVKSYKFSSSGSTHTMHVTTSGVPCNKPAEETCTYNYLLGKDAVTPVR